MSSFRESSLMVEIVKRREEKWRCVRSVHGSGGSHTSARRLNMLPSARNLSNLSLNENYQLFGIHEQPVNFCERVAGHTCP